MACKLCTCILLSICTATDLKDRVVYVGILVPFLLTGVLFRLLGGGSLPDLGGGLMVGAGLLVLGRITKGGIGTGDGLVLMTTGCLLGTYQNLRLLSGGLFLSAVFSLCLLLVRKGSRKTELPFLPFLLCSFLLMLRNG